MRIRRALYALAISLFFCHFLSAQNLGTGLYSFGSFDSRGFDSINIGNLNTHFRIPIFKKQGRGLNFDYAIVYEGLLWSNTNNVWQPDPGWGFHGQLLGGAFTGYLTYTQSIKSCPQAGVSHPPPGATMLNYVYHDPYGKNHHFNYIYNSCPNWPNDVITGNGGTSDGSGLSFGGSQLASGISDGLIHTRNGSIINAPVGTSAGTGSITDSNGNVVTNNGNGTFTDTLGATALTITGGGNAASPLKLAYPVALQSDSATSATVTIYYKTYTVKTNFQCLTSGTAITEYPATSVDLVDHITLPDASASTYTFTYESIQGGGAVTGRLKSITLPTGGTISYTYTGGCAGSGINSDGSPAILTRTTTDGVKTYTRTISGTASTTGVVDEKLNNSTYTFISSSDGFWYETERKIYQGPASGTPLEDRITNYNGQTTPAQLTTAITQTAIFDSFNGVSQLETDNVFDASGMLTSSIQKSGTTTLQSVTNSYNSLEELLGSTTKDGSGNTVASSTYGYDECPPPGPCPTATSGIPQHGSGAVTRGNQTSAHVATGSGTLDTTTTYYDTGVPLATTTPNGKTQYSYDSTQAFVTTTTLPTPSSGVPLATSASYDQQSGAALSVTGMNSGQMAQVTQYDRLLRPVNTSLPNNGTIKYNYESSTQTGIVQSMSSSQNADTETLVDGYGRTSRVAVYNGQASNPWYQVDYCYDKTGNLSFQSTRYQSTGFVAPIQCSGSGTTYVYDALGRMTSSTNADGTTSYQYTGRAMKVTDVNNNVQKITQYDLLGRISTVCEISSSTGSSPCTGTDIAGTGFLTNYSYTPSALTTTITQGAQSRVIQTDQAGRTISVTEPERGTTAYSYAYNSTGLVITRTRPKANQNTASVLTTTTTQYDSLGRIVSISYDDGLTPTKSFTYDTSANWSESQVNLKGNLSQISVGTSTGQAASIFSYDLMGWPYFDISCTPPRCGAAIADHGDPYTHDLVGNILTTSDAAGPTYTYTYSPASEVLSITSSQSDSSHPPNLVSNVQNGPNGPISYALGNGLNVAITYDSLGRLNGSWVCKNSSQPGCTGGTQTYGSNVVARKGSQITNVSDNVTGQNTTYGYDEFNRLTSANFGSGAKTFSYVYDRYGNRSQQNAPQGGPAPSYLFNTANNQISTVGYDAAGNVISDNFHQYTYDAEGNILKVDAGATAIYAYDALNHRIRQDVGTKTTAFVYNAEGQRISYWNAANTQLIQGQVYWGNKPIAFRENGEHFQHQDYLGTERMTTNWTGSTDGSFTSLPFGDGYTVSGSDYDQYHFALLDHDSETSTEHAQFRQYSSTQGRWMSPDSSDGSYDFTDPQSFNRYNYAMNNPVSVIDPLGLSDCTAWEISHGLCMTLIPHPPGDPGVDTTDPSTYNANDGPPMHSSGGAGKAPSIAMAIPPGAPKNCSSQLADMLNDINAIRGSNASGFKGLAQRFGQIINGNYANAGHIEQFQNRQTQLQSKIDNYRNSGCGEPPASVTAWAAMPTASPWTPPNLQNFKIPVWVAPTAIITGGVACAVFIPGCLEVEGVVILAP